VVGELSRAEVKVGYTIEAKPLQPFVLYMKEILQTSRRQFILNVELS